MSSQNAEDANVLQSTGQAHLRLEIEIPRGTSGSEPELALTYTSGRAAGPFGIGWNVEFGEIRRSARFGTPAYDDAVDEFEFDGVLLVADANSPPGRVEYRTIQESFARIAHIRDESANSSSWQVEFPDGRIARFGTRQQARIRKGGDLDPEDDGGAIGRWLLSELEDANGNVTRFDYERGIDVGTAYPRAIRYSFRNGALVGGVERRVEFELGDRPDELYGFPAGLETRVSQRVTEIRSVVRPEGTDEQVYRRYALNYAAVDRYTSTGRSRLDSVQIFGTDCALNQATTRCEGLPAKKFTYTDTSPAIPNQPQAQWEDLDWGGGSSLAFTQSSGKDRGVRIGDVNGDGFPDFVQARRRDGEPDQHEVYLSDGRGWGSSDAAWGAALAALTVDAHEIVEIRPNDEVTCAIESPPTPVQYGVSFAFDGVYAGKRIRPMIQASLLDLNADGFADILLSFETGGGAVSADAPCAGAPYHWDPAPPIKYVWINKGKSAPDYPGDPDFGWERRDDWAASLPPFYSVFLWSDAGSGDLDRPGRAFPPGDNRIGLVGNNSTLGTAAYVFDHGVRMPDLNGDGRPDIVARRGPASFGMDAPVVVFPEGVWLSRADGVGWDHRPGSSSRQLPPEPIVVEFGHKAENDKFVIDADTGVRFADLNGDGLADLIKTAVGPIQNTNWRFEHQPLLAAMSEAGVWLNTGDGWCGPADPRCADAQRLLPTTAAPGAFTEIYAACNFITKGGVPPDPTCVKHARVRGTEFRFTDLNGDGLVDLLRTDDPDLYGMNAWIQDPSDPAVWKQDQRFVPSGVMSTIRAKKLQQQFGSYQIWDSGDRIFDFDGDATIDLLRHATGVERQMFVSRTAFLDLLATFDNGQGGIQELTYESAIKQRAPQLEADARADAADPVFGETGEIGVPRWTARAVVSQLVARDATPGGSIHSTLLTYAMPQWDPRMRSQLGFRAVESILDGDSRVRTFFWQKIGRTGRASRILNLDAQGSTLRRRAAIWEVIPGSDREGSIAGVYIGRVIAEESANFYEAIDGSSPGAVQSVTYRYTDSAGDSYGYNFAHEVEISRPSGRLTVERIPVPARIDPDGWLIGQLQREIHRDERGDLLKAAEFSYAGALPIRARRTVSLRHEPGASEFADTANGYDGYGNLISRTDPEGRTHYFCYDGDASFADGSECPDAMEAASHTAIVGLLDPRGEITLFGRDLGSGIATSLTRLYSGDSESIDLDRFGRPTRLWTQPDGHETGAIRAERNYVDGLSAAGRPYIEQWDYFAESAATNATAAVRSAVYLDGFGRETVGVSPAAPGRDHPFGRAITARDPAGRPLRATLDLACADEHCTSLPTDAGTAAISQTYDALGRVRIRTTPDGATAFDYRSASVELPVGPGAGTAVSLDAVLVKDPKGNLTEYLFDGDRLLKTGECENGVSAARLDLSGVTCSDPDSTFYTYEASGELDAIYDAHPDQDFASAARRLEYHHDTLGRVWKVSDPDRGVSYTAHDRVGNVIQTIDARGRSIAYRYDELDRLERIDTPGGPGDWDRLEIAYDPVTRKRSRVSAAGMSYSESWEYDEFGNLARNIRSVIGRTLRTDFEHDLLGRLISLKSPLSSRESVRYVYEGAYLSKICSRRDAASCDAAPQISFIDRVAYDAIGRVATISEPIGDLTYAYYEVGDSPEGRVVGRLKSMSLDGARLQLAYAYDANGNPSRIVDRHTGDGLDATSEYLYDRRNRLVSWKDAEQIERHFAYDSIGNLVGRNLPAPPDDASDWNQVYDVSNKPHALRMNWSDRGYDYDAAGNVVRRGDQYLTYNSLGQLHCVGDSPGSCSGGFFWYDVDGRLLSKTAGGSSEIYLGDYFRFDTGASTAWTYTSAFGKRIAVAKQTGAVLRAAWTPSAWPPSIGRERWVQLLGGAGLLLALALLARLGAFETLAARPIAAGIALGISVVIATPPQAWALRRGRTPTTEIRYLFHDHLGTEILEVDATGGIEQRRIFEPFGEVVAARGDWTSGEPAAFTGKRYHDEPGLYQFGARWYDAEGGRFVCVDAVVQSIADPQTHNPYGYARNNPIGLVDPNGREFISAFIIAAVVVKAAYYAALAYTAYSNVERVVTRSESGSSEIPAAGRRDSIVTQNTRTARGGPAGKGARSSAKNYGDRGSERLAGAPDPFAHTNPFLLEGSLDVGLGGGVKGSIPLISGEIEVFFGNSAIFDAFGESRVELAARALVRVNLVGFETTGGFELVETDRWFPAAGIDARFSRRLREEGLTFFNPFTNGFRNDAQIPKRLRIQPKLVLGLGGSLGVGVDLEAR